MPAFLSLLISPLTSIVTSAIDYFKNNREIKEVTRQKELEIEKTKVELAKQAESAEQLIALEGLKEPLGDRSFRRILVITVSLPLILCIPDIFGYAQFGSEIVQKYFTVVFTVIPEEYRYFMVSMVAGYFGITKVKETFFKGR